MRIALFTDTYLPNINGVVSSVELLRKKLEEKGHVVYVVSTYSGVFEVKEEGRIIRLPGLEIKKLYGYSVAQPLHLLFIERIKELKFDLIHAHTEFGVGIFASIVSKTLHIPLVRTYHTTYEDYTHYINFIDSKQLDVGLKKAVSMLSKLYGDDCKALIAPSIKTKELLLSYKIKTPIEVIPTGIEIDRFKYKKENDKYIKDIRENEFKIKDEKVLIFVGRIAQEKSIDLIIKTFKKVKENNLKLKLMIVGDGPDINSLKDLTSELDLNDYITFLGKKENSNIQYYYQSANGFISASTSETQGMTYIEALASGLVVFGRYDEVLDDLIKENENGYRFDNEEELFEKIKLFMSLDDKKTKEMSKNAIRSTDIYDANIFVDKVEALYQKVLDEYERSYVITKVKLKDDIVLLTLMLGDEEENLSVSVDDYYSKGLRVKQNISFELYDELKDNEDKVLAYNACLKRLSNKDYTVKQMYDYINKKYDIDIKKTNDIIDKLKELSLLDDYKYALSKANSLDRAMYSKRNTINKLKKDGVPLDIIESVINNDIDNELLKAKKLAKKYQTSIRNKSLNMKKQAIIRKLVSDGFSYEDAKEACGLLDFTDETFEEKDLLKNEASKQYKRLSKKYSGYELRNKLYINLFSKGFNSETIYALIDEMEIKDE